MEFVFSFTQALSNGLMCASLLEQFRVNSKNAWLRANKLVMILEDPLAGTNRNLKTEKFVVVEKTMNSYRS